MVESIQVNHPESSFENVHSQMPILMPLVPFKESGVAGRTVSSDILVENPC